MKPKDDFFVEIETAIQYFKDHKIRQYFTTFEGLNYCLKNDLITVEVYLLQIKKNNQRLKKQVRSFRLKTLATILRKWKN